MERLPLESHYKTEIRDGMSPGDYQAAVGQARGGPQAWGSWSHLELLAAQQIDALQRIEWVLHAVNSKKPPKQPEPVPRPGVAGGLLTGAAAPARAAADGLRVIAELKARQRAMGAEPTEQQIQDVLDEIGGGDE